MRGSFRRASRLPVCHSRQNPCTRELRGDLATEGSHVNEAVESMAQELLRLRCMLDGERDKQPSRQLLAFLVSLWVRAKGAAHLVANRSDHAHAHFRAGDLAGKQAAGHEAKPLAGVAEAPRATAFLVRVFDRRSKKVQGRTPHWLVGDRNLHHLADSLFDSFSLVPCAISVEVRRRVLTLNIGLLCDFATGADQIRNQSLVYIERSFVLGPIPHVVALRQDSPDFRPQAQSDRQQAEKRCTVSTPGIRGAGAPRDAVRERRCTRDRTGCPESSLRFPRPSDAPGPNARGRQTPSHPKVPLRGRSLDLRDAQAATGRSCSDPITQSFGWPSTRVTNAFSVRARFENSVPVYTVGLTFRPTVRVTRSKAPKTSPYVRLSLMIIRSMSLADWSVALAMEPYTKAARISPEKGLRAARSGSARPTVFNTI